MDQASDITTKISKRFAFRLGNRLPKVLRILYYIVLFMSMIYFIYRFFEWVLVTFQKFGQWFFRPQNYWAAVMSIGILVFGSIILAQFVLGLDPWGYVTGKITDLIEALGMRYV